MTLSGRTTRGGAAGKESSSSAGAFETPTKKGKAKRGEVNEALVQKWTPPQSTFYSELDPPVTCNRPGCTNDLQLFVPPGTDPNKGVTFAKCKDPACAGGGSILTFDTKCFVCYRVIPGGTICLSFQEAEKKFKNIHLRNCLLDKIPDSDDSAVATNASGTDVRWLMA